MLPDNKEFRKIKSVSRQIELSIEKYASDGVSIGYEDSKVIFVRYAIPGEKVMVNIYKETKDYALAEPIEIITPSPDRISPECRYFGLCGGCDYQMLAYSRQLEIKTALVLEAFHKIGKLELDALTGIVSSGQEFYYRNTETFKVNPRRQLIGFFRKDTKFIVDLEECKLAMPDINTAMNYMRTIEPYPAHNFKVRSTSLGETTVNWIDTDIYEDRPLYEDIHACGKTIRYKISKDSFFQVNNSVIPLWLEKIVGFLDESHNERIFDLYCGIGLITLFVAPFAKETIGVEIAKSSVKDADHNLEINRAAGLKDANVRFILGDVMEVLPGLGSADVMIIDPPRKGAERNVLDLMMGMEPRKIIYSSCKPSTMARDLQILSDKYDIREIYLVDMFPQTHHVEMLTLLVKK
jgi:23S rRNA (uracil1939-C5)-methyltransferase